MTNKRIKYLINHWSDTSPQSTVSDIRHIHLSKGWRDIGYHRVILHPDSRDFKVRPTRWDQLVKLGRSLDEDLYIEQNEIGAHTLYHNANSVGICTIGSPRYDLDPLQATAIAMVNAILADRFELRLKDALMGHRDFNATQCPGDEIYQLIKHLKGESK